MKVGKRTWVRWFVQETDYTWSFNFTWVHNKKSILDLTRPPQRERPKS